MEMGGVFLFSLMFFGCFFLFIFQNISKYYIDFNSLMCFVLLGFFSMGLSAWPG